MNGAAELVASASDLAALPSSYVRLTRALEAPGATAEQISGAVRLDPALTARLLRLVNSPAYAPKRPVESIAHAVSLAGTSLIKRLALATSMVRLFKGLPENLVNMRSFWTHSVAVAIGSGALAARMKNGPRGDGVFVGGLLHDLGTLLLCLKCPNEVRQILTDADQRQIPHDQIEREILGFSHADVGAQLLLAWGLPPQIVAAAAWHPSPSRTPTDLRPVVDLVHLADVMASALQIGGAGERAAHRMDLAALERTGLGPEDFRVAAEQVELQVSHVVDAMVS
ncbi:MAG: HDOD domain-containing protein [Myxococcota bacterium]